jgi:hypothetical protein
MSSLASSPEAAGLSSIPVVSFHSLSLLFGIGSSRLEKLPPEQERNDDKPQSKEKQAGDFTQATDLAHPKLPVKN